MAYEGIVQIYDMMMAGVDYEAWADYILALCEDEGTTPQTVLDLACGTGNTVWPLAKRGLHVTGLDLSAPMLKAARAKASAANLVAEFVCGDMTRLSYDRRFDLVTSFQDGINYLTGEEDLHGLCRGVAAALRDGGLFLFDLNLVDQYEREEGERVHVVDLDEVFMAYKSCYLPERAVWSIQVTGFLPTANGWRRFDERHEEKNHSLVEVEEALNAHGFTLQHTYAMFTREAPAPDTRRLMLVARRGER